MYNPLSDPRDISASKRPTWRNVVAGYAMMAAVVLLLWVASEPVVHTLTLVAVVGLLVAVRRVVTLARCVDCRRLTVDLAGRLRLTISQSRLETPN